MDWISNGREDRETGNKEKAPKSSEEAAEPKHAHAEQPAKPKKEETDSSEEKEKKEEKPEKKEKPAKKAKEKKEEKKKEIKERIITIKFRSTKGSSIGRRKNKIIRTVRAGVQRGHKDKRVIITMELNHKLWAMGRNKLPNSIKVRIEDDGETLKTSPV